jgi:hypothetical protein
MTKNSLTSSNFEISLQDEIQQEMSQEHLGRMVAKSLDQNLENLPPHLTQGLEKARILAISKKKPEKSYAWNFSLNFAGMSSSSKSGKTGHGSWLKSLGSIAPIIVLLVGLAGIAQWQQDARIDDIADIDAALLSDEVPPDAYADNGFWVFMKNLTNQEDDSKSSESALEGR